MAGQYGGDPLGFVRAVCAALPDVTERPSHGAPTWFVKDKKAFVMYHDDHHGDGRLALWCAAPPGAQEALTATSEDYFVPPYVGHRGWVGVRLDRDLSGDEVREACEEAYRAVAAKRQ